MKLKITTKAGGQSFETTMDVPLPANETAKHAMVNAVVQGVSTQMNNLTVAGLAFESMAIEALPAEG